MLNPFRVCRENPNSQKTGNEKSFVVIEKLVTRQIRARNFLTISPKVFFRQTLKGLFPHRPNAFSVDLFVLNDPGLSLRSNPGLKLANAFGVILQLFNCTLRQSPDA
jgi:hypothetical protein